MHGSPTPAPRLLAERIDEPDVEAHTFLLVDPASAESPLASAQPPSAGRIVDPGTRGGGAVFATGGDDFRPTLRLESWSAQPPLPEGAWDTVDEVVLDLPSGTVLVSPMDAPAEGEPVELGPPGRYCLRAVSRGRVAAARRSETEEFFRGEEEWVLQLWPESDEKE